MKKLLGAALAAMIATGAAAQEDYPNRAITILVPFAPGGVVDLASRTIGEGLSRRLGQEVIVENRAGGSGFIAASAAAQAEPDGYTLFMGEAGTLTINPSLFEETPYDAEADFTTVSTITDTPLILVANKNASFKTFEEFLEAARAEPGAITYSSAGIGTLNHLAPEWMSLEGDIQIQHIPYKGGRPAATAVASGEVDVSVVSYSSTKPFIDSGDVIVLATTSAKRIDPSPETPTMQEGGVPNVDTSQWTGLMAPAGTPDAVLDKLNATIAEILAEPDVAKTLTDAGAAPYPSSREDFDAMLDRLRGQFKTIIETAGITAQ
ncbi:Bug family tripartite tricarboxylate transporter substrate binding protein [Roseovarius atlanticus]|uniref:Bug family tripartite tricarboxylate transporter substrate binding protein n=1 Tax=Roseovarius atlanticus TaxID=1641875 RepID=UPI001C977035|nr:tripartite tricarboxylate transporter substrate binding protein [Roseovarius atlanticus]MBY5990307.1 tripartite tricarboxylate transporter substrate binding protein [Roseovarius atlanticus]MBY6126853.1 tripartite tricarboxylate transporter substrate binding protein [Roseovarius atlanticus]MBY6151346.1 tripartite tricarboxylate transporter substrate binding protein [Roseovarius atlanticus]